METSEPRGEMKVVSSQGQAFDHLAVAAIGPSWKCLTHGNYEPRCAECVRAEERERCADVAFKTHKLKHIESCRCKRCREAEKIRNAIRGTKG